MTRAVLARHQYKSCCRVDAKVVVNDTNYQTYSTLKASLGDQYKQYGESGILHSKMMVIDQSNPQSDPTVWTGSHNWSSAADQKNDENSIVIHDATIANIYYQEFMQRFKKAQAIGGQHILNLGPDQEKCAGLQVDVDAGTTFLTYNWSTGDIGVKTITIDSTGVGIGTKRFGAGSQMQMVYNQIRFILPLRIAQGSAPANQELVG